MYIQAVSIVFTYLAVKALSKHCLDYTVCLNSKLLDMFFLWGILLMHFLRENKHL